MLSPYLGALLASEHQRELRRRSRSRSKSAEHRREIRLRKASSVSDAADVRRIAELDSSHVPAGTILIADVDGRAAAAMSVESGHVVADPFTPTADAVAMLLGLRRLRLADR